MYSPLSDPSQIKDGQTNLMSSGKMVAEAGPSPDDSEAIISAIQQRDAEDEQNRQLLEQFIRYRLSRNLKANRSSVKRAGKFNIFRMS